jgi:serine/threonine protein kinase
MTRDPTNESDRDGLLNEILLEYVEAVESGRAPKRWQFLEAHPEFRSELEEFFASHDAVERFAAPLRDAPAESGGTGKEAIRVSPTAHVPSTSPSELGQLGDFRLLREIGRGGMGVVYEAEQISLRRRVALKVLPFAAAIDPRQLQRFRNEAMAAAHLRHEHIVPVYAVGSERGIHFYAMQFIEGQSLAALIDELRGTYSDAKESSVASRSQPAAMAETTGPKLTAGSAETRITSSLARAHSFGSRRYFNYLASLGRQAALALEHAHQTGIIHRDIKPANLLLDPRGDLWVTDFGLALVSGSSGVTVAGELLGTLRYASPEQALALPGLVDQRSDVYSLGATLYELLTLRPIFSGRDRHELLQQIANVEPRPLRSLVREIPIELETIILKAIAKEPADRYATAQELADDLGRYLADQPIRARRPSSVEKVTKWARRHRTVVIAGLILLILLAAGSLVSTALIQGAYERERQRAEEAEAQFRLARRSVDEMVELANEEMASKKELQGLRKRLLQSALKYYQEFIEQHREVSPIQAELEASRAKVETILSELATLMGTRQYIFLHQKHVQDELHLDADQREALARMDQKWHSAMRDMGQRTPEERERRFVALAQEQEAEVATILSPAQLRRFQQVALQCQGPAALLEVDVARTLKLTADQKKRIRTIEADMFAALPKGPNRGPAAAEARRTEEDVRKTAHQRVQALLTEEQAQQWRALTGPVFDGAVLWMGPRFPPPPGPPNLPGRPR